MLVKQRGAKTEGDLILLFKSESCSVVDMAPLPLLSRGLIVIREY